LNSSPVWASPSSGDIGVGVVFGQPTGLVAKFWQTKDRAIDAGVAYSFNRYIQVYGDYLFHFAVSPERTNRSLDPLSFYVGGGALLSLSSLVSLGLRIPLGLEWIFNSPKVGIFLEVVPGVSLIPSTAGFVQGGIGARYYF